MIQYFKWEEEVRSGVYLNWDWKRWPENENELEDYVKTYKAYNDKGVYMVYAKYSSWRKLMYVGMSINLWQRLKHHPVITLLEDLGLNPEVKFFKTESNPADLESILIRELTPPLNRPSNTRRGASFTKQPFSILDDLLNEVFGKTKAA